VGAMVANTVCPYLLQKVFTTETGTNFHGLFLVPCGIAIVAAVMLALFFHPPARPAEIEGAVAPAH
jgi:hypothetical protein